MNTNTNITKESINNNIKVTKVGIKTNPHTLGISLMYSLNSGLTIKAYAIGDACKTLMKGIAYLNSQFPGSLDFQPNVEIIEDNEKNLREAVTVTIRKI